MRWIWTCCLVVLFAGSSRAVANQINWYVRDWPPVNILSGPLQGQGAYDLMLQQLINRLPQYNHQIQLSTLTMRQQMMQQQVPHCLFGLLKTAQRQTFLRFSEPYAAIPNLQFIALADHPLWQRMPAKKAVSMQELVQLSLRGLAEQGRTYPQPLADLMTDFVQVTATEAPLLQLLQAGRADYLLEYPDRAFYLANQDNIKVRMMPISDLPAMTEVYVACSLTEESKGQIQAINEQLRSLRHSADFRDALVHWLSPESQQQVQQYMKNSPWFDGASQQ